MAGKYVYMYMSKAVIIGAGPAGLTAAYELVKRTPITPYVLEKSDMIGGLSKTVNYKGNRIDIGGHRFFSKSTRVMDWWQEILPLEGNEAGNPFSKTGDGVSKGAAPEDKNMVMLLRNRISRIYFLKRFFSYPVSLSADTVRKLGVWRATAILFSYIKSRLFPRKEEKSLEDFFINRFGYVLYHTFFKDYTEKVWGISCKDISAEWGAQRIKGLSITKALQHALKGALGKTDKIVGQKKTETSLIECFLYPKYGPGQMWERVADLVAQNSGEIMMERDVMAVNVQGNKVVSVVVLDKKTNREEVYDGDYFFSSMPIKELVAKMKGDVPGEIRKIADGLLYRDFITVGLLLKKMKIKRDASAPAGAENTVKDNWVYIQEREVKVGRLQIFNNWSPFMVKDPDTVWLGLEYFCNEGDELWSMPDDDLMSFAIGELEAIGMIDKADVLDSIALRVEKAYPAYFGSYDRFPELKTFVSSLENLFLVGRNGMHKYNNSDHSMLTAMTAVDNIIANRTDKENIWSINMEQEYHETSKTN